MNIFQKLTSFVFVTGLCLVATSFIASNTFAQEPTVIVSEGNGLFPTTTSTYMDVNSPVSGAFETHPPLTLTPEKSEILYLSEDVKRVIVGNEFHVAIFLDTAKRAIIVPRAPGATHVTFLGDDGSIIMQRYIIVAAPKENYLRVRQTCGFSEDGSCLPIKMYYCDGLCHETATVDISGRGASSSVARPSEEMQKEQIKADSRAQAIENSNEKNDDNNDGSGE